MAWDNFMIRNKFKNVELIKTASLKQNAFREAVLVFLILNSQQ